MKTLQRKKQQTPIVFDQSKDVSLLYLLLQGQIPPSFFSEQRFLHLLPIVEAVSYLHGIGETPPYNPKRIWSIAHTKFNGSDTLKDKLKDIVTIDPDKPVLEVIRQRLVYEKILDAVSQQLDSGKYNPEGIIDLLEGYKDTQQTVRAVKLRRPRSERVQYITQSHIRKLDRLIGGFGAELILVGAPPKMGKSNFFINVAARQPPHVKTLYVTVADYSADDISTLVNVVHPGLFNEEHNFYIADYTGLHATILDIEQEIKAIWEPDIPMLVIVDRAEKMKPMAKGLTDLQVYEEIFYGLRRLAKRYTISMFADAQYGRAGQDYTSEAGEITSSLLYGDHTIRQSVMDMFIGILREENETTLFLEGRRQGKLPAAIAIETSDLGVYKS